jgi:hypothetical protein
MARGLRGRVENGTSGGGIAYGYGVAGHLDQSGELQRGDRETVEHEAQIVRHIFNEFASGAAPRAITKTLNDEGVPGPGGSGPRGSKVRTRQIPGSGPGAEETD